MSPETLKILAGTSVLTVLSILFFGPSFDLSLIIFSSSDQLRRITVYLIGLVVCSVGLTLVIAMSAPFRRWLDRGKYGSALDRGVWALEHDRNLEAALAFQAAISYHDSPNVRVGLAYALDRLGDLDAAIHEYGRAYRGTTWGTPHKAARADFFVRALMRRNAPQDLDFALDACQRTLGAVKGISHREIDELGLSFGVLLFVRRQDSEAREQFRKVAAESRHPDIQERAKGLAVAPTLVEAAREGPEQLWRRLYFVVDMRQRRN